MRIDSTGKLLVGTTSGTAAIGQFRNASNPALGASVSGSSVQGTAVLQISKPDATNTTSQIFAQFYVSDYSTGSGQINANGAGAVAFGSFSDIRLKDNVVGLDPQLNNILSLRPIAFDYIESEGGGRQIGFIAQEVQEIYPDCVGERQDDGMLTLTGWSKTEARLVKAIQEQQAMIAELQAKVAALESA
jgi:hypothetical protein